MPVPRPSHRPSFGQRDAYRDLLSEGYAQGRLDDAEFARRAEAAQTATSLERLEELIADLPRGDVPLPVARGRGGAPGGAGQRRRRAASRSVLSLVTAAALVGLAGGIFAGPFMAEAQSGDSAEAGDRTSDDDGSAPSTTPSFAHDDVIRAFDLAADYEQISRIIISGTSVQLHVPTASGTTFDVVTADQRGGVSTDPGGTYGEGEPDARFDPSALDPEEVAAMVVRAPDVYAETTGEDGNAASRLDLGAPGSGTAYAGVRPGSPVVRVSLELGDYGDGGGTVTWTPDGGRVLEVLA